MTPKQFWQAIALSLATILTALVLVVAQAGVTVAQSPEQVVAQVTSVSQFTDVRRGDYYFEALQSLAERYGCVVGHRDGTFRFDRPVVRGELVGMVSACIDRTGELIANATADLATLDDLETMRRILNEIRTAVASQR